jgi:hypothetical protein
MAVFLERIRCVALYIDRFNQCGYHKKSDFQVFRTKTGIFFGNRLTFYVLNNGLGGKCPPLAGDLGGGQPVDK